ncbi:MAG: NAD(P)-dependent glycerol-3-phosphate dehydrogenase [Candidatus Omnitrophica bacterium]|nr:NAD(P)-dependent glycerol-3-phosphate dehydrogenase [Candidatus Omnitrophota bacterium]
MKNRDIKKITVLGDGGWGTALAVLLAGKGFEICLWSAFKDNAARINKNRENRVFLPGIILPENITVVSDTGLAVADTDMVVIAIPSQFLRQTIQRLKGFDLSGKTLVSVVKGIENNTFHRPSEIIRLELGGLEIGVLSGPTIAIEIAKGLPASCVSACRDLYIAGVIQSVFTTDRFRVYTSTDVAGVETAGALKNIMAIASGISDGLGLGSNAKAALFTRGLVEMKRLGLALGAQEATFNGLSGMGDLVTTCVSSFSRNRKLGEDIAKGKTLSLILQGMSMVAEGVETTRSVYNYSAKLGIEMPITEQVYKVLFEDKPPYKAVIDLMLRESKPE